MALYQSPKSSKWGIKEYYVLIILLFDAVMDERP